MDLGELIKKGQEFDQRKDIKDSIAEGKQQLKIFLGKYPFREKPDLIDTLKPENIYNPGSDDYFFIWVEYRTSKLGSYLVYSAKVYLNAVNNIDQFKQLLKVIVDEKKPIRDKIDFKCDIKGLGGDKQIVKKILFCYFSDSIIPIFKTEHLEYFCKQLKLNYREEALRNYGKDYENLTVGEKYELLTQLLLNFKKEHFPSWDNILFARFLYNIFQEVKQIEKEEIYEAVPFNKFGLLFEPQSEQEVVFLFSKLHEELDFPYIIKFQSNFPDVIVLDKSRTPKRIEIEKYASEFKEHGHSVEDCDFIVCWENDLTEEDIPEKFPKIISLKTFIEEYMQ